MFKIVMFLVLTDSRTCNLEYRFPIKVYNFNPLSNSSPFCYTSKVRVRKHGYFGANWRLMEISTHGYLKTPTKRDADVMSASYAKQVCSHG